MITETTFSIAISIPKVIPSKEANGDYIVTGEMLSTTAISSPWQQ